MPTWSSSSRTRSGQRSGSISAATSSAVGDRAPAGGAARAGSWACSSGLQSVDGCRMPRHRVGAFAAEIDRPIVNDLAHVGLGAIAVRDQLVPAGDGDLDKVLCVMVRLPAIAK